jgi:hypothetical protein
MKNNAEKVITLTNAKKETGIHYTLEHTGKMAGMYSLSTSNLVNPFCKAHRACKGSICEKCYACAQMKRYTSMQKCMADNFRLLTEKLLTPEQIPVINALVFRFEAFGDVYNAVQVANYFAICKKNPQTRFALWTKNPAVIEKAINAGFNKPNNLVIILSSLYINEVASIEKWSFVDKVFTVYDNDTIEREHVEINCGANNCFACQKCYHKDNGETYINEKLK